MWLFDLCWWVSWLTEFNCFNCKRLALAKRMHGWKEKKLQKHFLESVAFIACYMQVSNFRFLSNRSTCFYILWITQFPIQTHGLADWQIRISVLSSPLTDQFCHFLQEPHHFSFRLRARGEFCTRNPPLAQWRSWPAAGALFAVPLCRVQAPGQWIEELHPSDCTSNFGSRISNWENANVRFGHTWCS